MWSFRHASLSWRLFFFFSSCPPDWLPQWFNRFALSPLNDLTKSMQESHPSPPRVNWRQRACAVSEFTPLNQCLHLFIRHAECVLQTRLVLGRAAAKRRARLSAATNICRTFKWLFPVFIETRCNTFELKLTFEVQRRNKACLLPHLSRWKRKAVLPPADWDSKKLIWLNLGNSVGCKTPQKYTYQTPCRPWG